MIRTCLLLLAAAVLLGCASAPDDLAAVEPIDWSAVASVGVPVLVTSDPDGSARETKLWLAVVDEQGFVRTSGTRWFQNIERDPNVVLRIAGRTYPLRAERIADSALHARVNEAFRAKYGLSDRMVGWFSDRPSANIMALMPR